MVPVELEELPDAMRRFLTAQLPLLTADGAVLPDGIRLCTYDGCLTALPVNAALSAAAPVAAERPLLIVAERPAETLSADGCLLPLTSSGNILFSDAQALAAALDGSPLAPYAALKRYAPA